MNKALKLTAWSAAFLLLTVILLVGCQTNASPTEGVLAVGTIPVTTAAPVPEGILYVRCSEPEDNTFSIQFISAVPTRAVDYVGFEACKAYEDGTRGSLSVAKLTTLYNEMIDENKETSITAKDFGLEEGYLFAQSLNSIPIDQEGLAYEITAFYVIGEEKFYLARQVFAVSDLLKDHILKDPTPLTVIEESPIVDVQKWVPYTQKGHDGVLSEVEEDCLYYMGASAPDNNGNLDLYICYALSDTHYNHTGVRYRFTATQGEDAGVSTSLCRLRDDVVYRSVRTETETLTAADFGLEDGYLVVLKLSDSVNTVLRRQCLLELVAYYSRNALETHIIEAELDFDDLVEKTVVVSRAVPVGTYQFVPEDYSEWVFFSEANGNATGEGVLGIRVTEMFSQDTVPCFDAQITAATPTRFANKMSMIYTVYDENGDPISENTELASKVQTLFLEIFGNSLENDDKLTSVDFGVERGYLMSMVLHNIKLSEVDLTIGLRVTYTRDDETTTLVSLMVPVRELVAIIPEYTG